MVSLVENSWGFFFHFWVNNGWLKHTAFGRWRSLEVHIQITVSARTDKTNILSKRAFVRGNLFNISDGNSRVKIAFKYFDHFSKCISNSTATIFWGGETELLLGTDYYERLRVWYTVIWKEMFKLPLVMFFMIVLFNTSRFH